MNPTRPCPRCARPNPGTHTFCSSCGERLAASANKTWWKLVLGTLAVFGGVLWAGVIYTETGREAATPPPARSTFLGAEAPAPPAAKPPAQPAAKPQAVAVPSPSPTPRAAPTPATASRTAPASPAAERTGQATANGGAAARRDSGTSSDDYYTNVDGKRVHRPVQSPGGAPAGATAQCRDGSYSFSQNRRGTCSHHGGVARWL